MIYVDDRIGSVHYAKALFPSQIERLEYGDICFEGANGKLIGIECKKIGDLISSILSGRLADHQLPGMRGIYDYSYLIVEGYYRPDPESGLLQQWRGGNTWKALWTGRQGFTWSALEGWITSMEMLVGLHVRRTTDQRETVATVMALYHWWQKAEHKSLHVFNTAQDAAALERPGTLRRMAAQLPLVGWERSLEVGKKLAKVFERANTTESDWIIPGEIGPGIAKKIVKAIRGE